jgi:RNA polymerase sigma-70 factor (ECF subfamily)
MHSSSIRGVSATLAVDPPAGMLSSSVKGYNGVSSMTGAITPPLGRGAQSDWRWRGCLERIRTKDAQALAEFYDETSSLLYGLAMRILNDPADAEEVVLDVYQHVWKSAHAFDENRGSVWGWLAVLTRSRAIDRLRQAGVRRRRELPVEHGQDKASGSPGPELQSLHGEERRMVRRALETLSSGEREAIELAYFSGLTHVEVAEALGEPLGTVKTRIRAGLRKLRDALAPVARKQENE